MTSKLDLYRHSAIPRSTSWLPRTFRGAAWLGWTIESNWADPFVFAIYSIIKPVSSAAILVVMYSVITGGNFDNPVFPYIYLGNAFYIYVGAIMTGISWAVIEDREHYRMLKYMYIAPIHYPTYLLGRGVARFIFGSISVIITIAFGVLFLNVPIDFSQVQWGMLLLALFMGVIMLSFMGLLLGSITMIIANHVWFIGDAVAGALYLFSGAIFPLAVLPAWLQPVGYAMPITYWLELMRRALVGDVAEAFPTLAAFSNLQLFGILGALTVVFGFLAFAVYRWCDYRARELGYIDRYTNY